MNNYDAICAPSNATISFVAPTSIDVVRPIRQTAQHSSLSSSRESGGVVSRTGRRRNAKSMASQRARFGDQKDPNTGTIRWTCRLEEWRSSTQCYLRQYVMCKFDDSSYSQRYFIMNVCLFYSFTWVQELEKWDREQRVLSWTCHIHQRWIVSVQSGTKWIFASRQAANNCFLVAYIIIPCALVVISLSLCWSGHATFDIVNTSSVTITIHMIEEYFFELRKLQCWYGCWDVHDFPVNYWCARRLSDGATVSPVDCEWKDDWR